MGTSNTILVAGAVAQKPRQGGHAWVFLQYLLGFRRLGYDVIFIDRADPGMQSDVRYLSDLLDGYGIEHLVIADHGEKILGGTREQLRLRLRESTLLLNVMGFLDDPELLSAAPRKVFLDIDPGFGQMWQDLSLHKTFKNHDYYVTIGENIGRSGCPIPDCGINWITTRQPIVLQHWPMATSPAGPAFTSIGAWRGPYAPIDYHGQSYGLRCHEFRKFLALPAMTGEHFALAMDIDPAETNDLNLLQTNGWKLIDPRGVAATASNYQQFIRSSRGELLVAKNMYVRSRSGWFSDRSICYLASGRPVIAQDTGLADLYPTGEGLLLFSTLDEAAAAVRQVQQEYDRHAAAARRLAEMYFDSDIVLPKLLRKLAVA
jgi:hypothetical protein